MSHMTQPVGHVGIRAGTQAAPRLGQRGHGGDELVHQRGHGRDAGRDSAKTQAGTPAGSPAGPRRDTNRDASAATAETPVDQAGTPNGTPPGQQRGAGGTGHATGASPAPPPPRGYGSRISCTTRIAEHDFPVGGSHRLRTPQSPISPPQDPGMLRPSSIVVSSSGLVVVADYDRHVLWTH